MAARTKERKFGTFLLDITNGISVSKWSSRLDHQTRLKSRAATDGSVLTSDRYTGLRFDFKGMVVGSDTGDAATKLGNLMSALTQGEQALRLYSDREVLARLQGPVRYSLAPSGTGTIYNVSAGFVSRLPYWRAVTGVTNQFIPTGAGPHVVATSNPAGDAPTWPTIKITNNGLAFNDKVLTLTNLSSSEQIQLIGVSLGSGDHILVDMAEGFIGDGSNVPIFPFAVDGLFWTISAGAATSIELAHNVGAGASWLIDVAFRASYWNE